MRFIYLGITIFLSVQCYSMPSFANEAQAALMGGSAASRHYDIPANLSAEEKSWFKVFQEGNLLVNGWQKISTEILAKTPAEQRQTQKIALENLGKKIGMEWCRPNEIRKVNTSMLQEWGSLLQKTARQNPKQLARAIAFIDQELDAVLD